MSDLSDLNDLRDLRDLKKLKNLKRLKRSPGVFAGLSLKRICVFCSDPPGRYSRTSIGGCRQMVKQKRQTLFEVFFTSVFVGARRDAPVLKGRAAPEPPLPADGGVKNTHAEHLGDSPLLRNQDYES